MPTDARHCLDLFSGLGGFSAAFADSDDWTVTTVDVEPEFDPDVRADVLDLRPADLANPRPDVVLASPPCTFFATIRRITKGGDDAWDGDRPASDGCREHVALFYHALGLIRALAPDYWFLENPRNHLRSFWRRPDATVWYCQYGHSYAKPTDLWGELPPMFTPKACSYGNDACGHVRTKSYKNHGGGSDSRQGLLLEDDPTERAKVPYELSEAILEAVKRAYENPQPTQTALPGVSD